METRKEARLEHKIERPKTENPKVERPETERPKAKSLKKDKTKARTRKGKRGKNLIICLLISFIFVIHAL